MATCATGAATMNTQMPGRLRLCPKTVFAIGLFVIAFGLLDVWWGLSPFFSQVAHGGGENVEILCIGVAALVGGVWTITGRNWARWLVAVWIALHVALSAMDPVAIAMHAAIFIAVVVGLFNSAASRYFQIRDAH